MRNQFQVSALFILVISIVLAGCSSPETKDDSYLTPIPESTISAYQENQDYPINNELEAVIAARHIMATDQSFVLSQDIQVVSVEKTTFLDVYKRFNYGTDHLEDAQIWFVVFKGSWQFILSSGKLAPLKTGCIYAELKVNDPERREFIGRDCLQE